MQIPRKSKFLRILPERKSFYKNIARKEKLWEESYQKEKVVMRILPERESFNENIARKEKFC